MSEQQEQPVVSADRRSFLKRKSFRICVVCVVAVIAVMVALPYGIRWYMQKWLVENGAESARIEKVRFVPFKGVFGLEGVEVTHGGKTVFADSTVYINLGLQNLFSKQAMLQHVVLEDIVLDVEMGSDGSIRVASYTIMPSAGKGQAKQEPEKVDGGGSPWTLFADRVDLKNVKVRYQQPGLNVDLQIDEAAIDKFNTDPDVEAGSLQLKGVVNGAAIEIDLPKLYVIPELDIEGRVVVDQFQLKELAELLGEVLDPFSGVASLDAKVKFGMTAGSDINVSYDGSVVLDHGNIGGQGWQVGGKVGYDGAASFIMRNENMEVVVDGDLSAKDASFDMPKPLIDIDNPDMLISGKTVVTIGESVLVDTDASLKLSPTKYVADGFKTGAGDTAWDGRIRVNTGTSEKDLTVDLEGEMSVHQPFFHLAMDKGMMETGNDLVSWDGKVLYGLAAGEGGGSYVKTDGKLVGEKNYYRLPEAVELSQGELELNGKTDVVIADEIQVAYDGTFNLGKTGLVLQGMALDEDQSSWKGKIGYTLKESGQVIGLHGDLTFSGTEFSIEESGLRIKQDDLQLQPDFEFTLGDKPAFEGSGGLAAKGLAVNVKDSPLVALESISVTGLKGDGSGGVVAGALSGKGFSLPPSETVPVGITVPSISLKEIHSPDLMSGSAASLIVEKPEVVDQEGSQLLAALDAVTVEAISVSKDIVARVDRVALENGVFLKEKEKEPMATLNGVVASDLAYSPEGGLVCKSIEVDSLLVDILKDKKPEPLQAEEEAKEEVEQEDAAAETAGLPVRIDKIDFTGTSQLKYADSTLARTFMTLFNIESLAVRDIDLNKPEQAFTYDLKGNFEKYTPLELQGECAPLAKNLLLRQSLVLRNYSMLRISPYVIEAIGTFFPSGMLDVHSKLDISEGNINMKNNMILKDLVLENVEGDLGSELDNQLPVPLSLAVKMLEDKDGLIDLDVPIKGKLSSISIGTSDLIWTPLSNAITVAVTPYLAYTVLGPAGALTYLGAKVGGGLLKTELPVLEFEKGQKELSEEHRKKLDKAGKIITKELAKKGGDDPEFGYSVCAKVSVSELEHVSSDQAKNQEVFRNEAIRRELFVLGEARSLAVKNYLVQNFEIDESRLMICNPGLQFDKEVNPVVEFMK